MAPARIIFTSIDLFRRSLSSRTSQPRSSAKKGSPLRKKWHEFANLFLARLMSVFGDLKSLRVLNAGRLCAIPFL